MLPAPTGHRNFATWIRNTTCVWMHSSSWPERLLTSPQVSPPVACLGSKDHRLGPWASSQASWWTKAASFSPRPLQEFFYAGPREELAQKTLLVSVWDYDLGTVDDFIGEWECGGTESGDGGTPTWRLTCPPTQAGCS